MAFIKTDPKEVLGMDQSELHDRLGKIDAVEARLAAMDGERKKDTSTILAQLEAMRAKPQEAENVDPDISFLSSPSAALEDRLRPLTQQTLENSILLQHRNARETYTNDFDRWGSEITQKMGELSAQQQADPRVWKAMVLMVRGDHASELERDGASGKFNYLEPVSAGLRPDPKTSDGLSSAEREMVRTLKPFGMTAEKYNQGKDRLIKSRASRLGRFAEAG